MGMGNFISGQHDGDQWFASVTTGADLQRESMLVSPYLRLDLAKAQLDAGKRDEAIATLRAVASADPGIAMVVRQRQARLLIDAGKGEEALALLAGVDDATSIEVRGDAHFALDKREDARKDYAEALRKLDVAAPQRQLLEFKLTQAGGTPETTGTES